MADDVSKLAAEAQKNLQEAQKLQEVFSERAMKGSLEQQAAYAKMVEMQKKFAQQNAEYLKSLEEAKKLAESHNALLKKRNALQEEAGKADEERRKEIEKELELVGEKLKAERDLHLARSMSTQEIKKQVEEQKKALDVLTKEKGLIGELAGAIKNKALQEIAAIATVGNALHQLSVLQKNALDISVLSGNYQILNQGYLDLVETAGTFEKNMAEARIGLRLLGHSSAEINQSFKEFSTTVGMTGVPLGQVADVSAEVTEVTGRLSTVLGVSLAEATQYSTEMTQRFNQTAGETASALYDVFKSTDKYNQAAGRTVVVARDVTKVMFDLARETKGVALEQSFLSKTLSQNILALQSQGRNYRESLENASMYVKKMSADAPDWGKIFAGRELETQMEGIGEAGGEALRKKLDAITPGLAARVQNVMKNVTDPVTKQRMLQELLEGTSFGFKAMEKSVGDLINRLGPQAAIALQEIYGVTANQADAMIEQVKLSRQLEDSKKRISQLDDLSGEARIKELEALSAQTGLSKDRVDYISKLKDGTQEQALSEELRYAQEKKHIEDIKKQDQQKNEEKQRQIAEFKKLEATARGRGDTALADSFKQKAEALQGTEGVNKELEQKMASIQGGDVGKGLSMVYEILTGAVGQLTLIAAAAGYQSIVQTTIALNTGGFSKAYNSIKDFLKSKIGMGGGGGGGGGGAAGEAIEAAEAAGGKGKGGLLKGASKWKTAGKLVKGLGGLGTLAAAGAVYDIATAKTKEERNSALAGGAGAVLGGAIGALGGPLGMAVGSAIGESLGKMSYDFFSKESPETNSEVGKIPVNAPEPPRATGTVSNLQGGTMGAGDLMVQATAALSPGAQGTDITIDFGKVTVPFAQAFAANSNLAAARGLGAVT